MIVWPNLCDRICLWRCCYVSGMENLLRTHCLARAGGRGGPFGTGLLDFLVPTGLLDFLVPTTLQLKRLACPPNLVSKLTLHPTALLS